MKYLAHIIFISIIFASPVLASTPQQSRNRTLVGDAACQLADTPSLTSAYSGLSVIHGRVGARHYTCKRGCPKEGGFCGWKIVRCDERECQGEECKEPECHLSDALLILPGKFACATTCLAETMLMSSLALVLSPFTTIPTPTHFNAHCGRDDMSFREALENCRTRCEGDWFSPYRLYAAAWIFFGSTFGVCILIERYGPANRQLQKSLINVNAISALGIFFLCLPLYFTNPSRYFPPPYEHQETRWYPVNMECFQRKSVESEQQSYSDTIIDTLAYLTSPSGFFTVLIGTGLLYGLYSAPEIRQTSDHCIVCWEYFNEVFKRASALACGHQDLCETCKDRIENVCPYCRKVSI